MTRTKPINALFITWPYGRDREPEYTVCWGKPGGGETQEAVTRARFLELLERAGVPTHTENNYRSYTYTQGA